MILHCYRECDLGRFLASLKSTVKLGRKTRNAIKSEWLELVRFSKTAESSRIYQRLDDYLNFALAAGFIS